MALRSSVRSPVAVVPRRIWSCKTWLCGSQRGQDAALDEDIPSKGDKICAGELFRGHLDEELRNGDAARARIWRRSRVTCSGSGGAAAVTWMAFKYVKNKHHRFRFVPDTGTPRVRSGGESVSLSSSSDPFRPSSSSPRTSLVFGPISPSAPISCPDPDPDSSSSSSASANPRDCACAIAAAISALMLATRTSSASSVDGRSTPALFPDWNSADIVRTDSASSRSSSSSDTFLLLPLKLYFLRSGQSLNAHCRMLAELTY